jgi:hypothetical protein
MPTPLLPAAPLPRPYSYWAATTAGYQQFFDSLPYWIWVPLLLLLIILPLLIMACLGCCCLLARSRGRKRKVAPISDVKSSMMPIPPPPAKIYISEASQTMPSAADNILNGRRENNVSSASAEERFFMDERNNGGGEYRSSKTAAFEDHGEFSLRDKKPASKPTRFSISRRPRDHHEEHMMDVGGYERPATPHQNYTTKSSEVLIKMSNKYSFYCLNISFYL